MKMMNMLRTSVTLSACRPEIRKKLSESDDESSSEEEYDLAELGLTAGNKRSKKNDDESSSEEEYDLAELGLASDAANAE